MNGDEFQISQSVEHSTIRRFFHPVVAVTCPDINQARPDVPVKWKKVSRADEQGDLS